MKNSLKYLLGVMFLMSCGIAMADDDHRDGDHDDHDRARVIIVPARHHHRRYHRRPVVHSDVNLNIGIGADHHDGDHHDDHH